jgi:dihydrofolate reductase
MAACGMSGHAATELDNPAKAILPNSLMSKPLTLIVACAENRIIGRDGRLPFDIPEDKAWFHEKTAGHTVVLGRICFETWPKVLADGRQPVVITSQPERILNKKFEPALRAGSNLRGAQVPPQTPLTAASVPAALALAQALPGEIMICGGQRIYEETLPIADRLLLTLVHAEVPGDTFFPEWRHLPWRETWRQEGRDANYRYSFLQLDRQQ